MLGPKAIGRWRFVHKWSSIACSLVLLVACVTGLPLIFSDEINRAFAPDVVHVEAPHVGDKLTLEGVLHVAEAAFPGQVAQFEFWPDDAPDAVGVGLQVPGSEDPPHRVHVDVWSKAVSEEVMPAETVLAPILELHRNLFVGAIGDYILAGTAVAFLIALISGVMVYRPFMRRVAFGTVRRTSRRTTWLDRHNLLGIATLAWAMVVAITGVMNALEGPLFEAWQSERTPVLMERFADRPPPTKRAALDVALEAARAPLGDYDATSIALPGSNFSTPRHYLIWFHGGSTLTKRIFTPVMVDGETGELASVEDLPWYLRTVEVSRPLHFGDYGGVPLEIMWALLDVLTIIVIVSGLCLWLRARRTKLDELL